MFIFTVKSFLYQDSRRPVKTQSVVKIYAYDYAEKLTPFIKGLMNFLLYSQTSQRQTRYNFGMMCKYTSAKLGSPKLILRVKIPTCTKPTREVDKIKTQIFNQFLFIQYIDTSNTVSVSTSSMMTFLSSLQTIPWSTSIGPLIICNIF